MNLKLLDCGLPRWRVRRAAGLFALVLLLAGCGGPVPLEERNTGFFAMDTYMTIRAYGGEDTLLPEAVAWVEALERQISVTEPDSALAALNRTGHGSFPPDGEAAALLRRALAFCGETGGALDISIYPVLRAWGFTTEGGYRVPAPAELEALLERVDYRSIHMAEDGTVTLAPGMELDLGSVAKGYVGDRLCALLAERGVESALLDLGGNVQALGGKPDGSAWRVGVRNPAGDGILGVLAVRDEAVITSGGYERYFTDEDGTLWWHIIDPATGYPARNGLISVTVVGKEGVYCDALSTALFVLGKQRALEFWRERQDFDCILATEDGRLLLTPGLAGRFQVSEGLAYAVEVLSDANAD